MTATKLTLPEHQKSMFGKKLIFGSHNLPQDPLFSDEALIELLDNYPRQYLFALTMGSDPTRSNENVLVAHDGVSGADLLRAVRNGRLWLNITRVNRADARYRALIDQLYSQLAEQVPGFLPRMTQGTLLVSSPGALVYYHVDSPASVLWHIRGQKRIWVYPALEERFVSRNHLEDLFAGARHEYLPYDLTLDSGAVVHDLMPGEWLAWPQNAPHRITNLDSLNVSLSTEHFTLESIRRARVYSANRYFRVRWHMNGLSTAEKTPTAVAKFLAHRVARKLGLDPVEREHRVARLRVDPDAPGGFTQLTEGVERTRSRT